MRRLLRNITAIGSVQYAVYIYTAARERQLGLVFVPIEFLVDFFFPLFNVI